MKVRYSIVFFIFVLMVFGTVVCADTAAESAAPAAASDQPSQPAAPPEEYRLQKEDTMKISVWNEPNLSAEQMVDPNGYIILPQLDPIKAEGLTVRELQEKVVEGLKKYLVSPKVQITITSFRKPKVYVTGEVNRPGVYEFIRGNRIMEAVSYAGGYTEMAFLEEATITHKDSKESLPIDLWKLFHDGDLTNNIELQDGDTINIPENTKNWINVMGEVMRPTRYRWTDNSRVLDAITGAGGPTDRASLKNTFVIRGDPQSAERIKVNLDDFMKKGDVTQNIALLPGDFIYVSETSKPNWGLISSIISAAANTSYLFRNF